MAFEGYFADFANDKRQFFAEVKTLDDARKRAESHDYGFLAPNEKLLKKEYELLWGRLQKGDIDHDAFWLYAYYCCIMLQNYHRAYGQDGKAEEFLKLRIDIKERLEFKKSGKTKHPKQTKSDQKTDNESFFEYLGKRISNGLIDLLRAPTKVSTIRDWVSALNVERIYWFFCRTTITKSLLLARELEILDRIGSVFSNIDVDNVVSILESPNPVLRVCSVAFFALRFIFNGAMLTKHAYGSEKEKDYDWELRLYDELYKRHPVLVNDLVWGIVNFITNYNWLTGIPDPTAGWIVAGFLFFDFCWLIWQRHLAEKEFLAKREQLISDRNFYNDLLINFVDEKGEPLTEEKTKEIGLHIKLLNDEIEQLEISWSAESSYFWFNCAAALLLAVGFSASMVFTAPVIAILCYAICTFGVAMYLSAGSYKNFEEKRLQAIHDPNNNEAIIAYNAARNEFIFTMLKNVFLPTLFIATFAICWQAAVVLTAVYLAYQLYSAYNSYEEKHKQQVEVGAENPVIEFNEEDSSEQYRDDLLGIAAVLS
ncbi:MULTISPECIES: hypothetical protein [Legionella]|nr:MULTISPECIES: hypothetical protein [Legionella]PJE07473.1 MAG: hypothetical protein CK430_13765 [Legionella sp.]